MNWTQATEILAQGRNIHGDNDADYSQAVSVVVNELPSVPRIAGSENVQQDWVADGDWTGNETPEQIIAEWNEYYQDESSDDE